MTRIAIVVAAARNGVIGDKGRLVWRIRDDLRWFKQVTYGKPVVMGRKTFDSIGKPLPGRANIVVTRNAAFDAEGVVAAGDIGRAMSLARTAAEDRAASEICIIGGGEIYRGALSMADRVYITRVDAEVSGDATFPDLNPADWREIDVGCCPETAHNEYPCEFFILERRRAGKTG